jgi:hypothetical protein
MRKLFLSLALLPVMAVGILSAQDSETTTAPATAAHALGSVSGVKTITCKGNIKGAVCQQLTVSCPGISNFTAYIKTNTPSHPVGTVLYAVGTGGSGLYDSIFTFGSTAVQNVLNAGFRTVQISFGSPFTTAQPSGWVEGPGGVLATACRYATIAQYVYSTVQNNKTIPMCATANSGGAGVLAYALSQYGSDSIISMAEVTSGPPTARLDWGCMCQAGKMSTPCGKGNLGTCFGTVDAAVWDPAYTPDTYCTNAVKGTPPPGGSAFFLADSVDATGFKANFPKTNVNIVFGGTDTSSAIPIGMSWYNSITSKKSQACVADAPHSLANVLDGATQIANDLIDLCKLQ